MTVGEMVQRRRLGWLGHVARMPDHRIFKSISFWMAVTTSPTRRPGHEGDEGMGSGET